IEYTFLSDFDLLRDPDRNATIRKWAEPATCQILDTYHKIHCAWEEIVRLNIEIKRFVTYIRDKKEFLVKEHEIAVDDPELVFFIRRY
ncbi:hypothetical protein C8R45DRAFT_802259, partial [Mycena sanguinolenta]